MGNQILAAATAAKTSTSSSSSLLLIVLVFGVLAVFMFRSQSKRKRAAQNTQSQIMNGTRVRTVHGIYGTIVDGDDRNVLLEVSPGDEPDGLNPTMQAFEDTAADGDTSQSSSANAEDRSDLSR
jgi:preprotein translocase YajC subunit